MNCEYEIQVLKEEVKNLREAFLQSQRNQVPITERTDESHNKIPQVDANTENIETTSANLDYVAMMVDVDIPTEDE